MMNLVISDTSFVCSFYRHGSSGRAIQGVFIETITFQPKFKNRLIHFHHRPWDVLLQWAMRLAPRPIHESFSDRSSRADLNCCLEKRWQPCEHRDERGRD